LTAYIGITGTPGTGKKTLAPLVAASLGVPCHSLSEPAFSSASSRPMGSEIEINAAKLGKHISATVKPPCLLYGHLLPYAFGRDAFSKVVVLRCDPAALGRRLAKRGYGAGKILENVEAELIGVISADAMAAFGRDRVGEVDTSKPFIPATVALVARQLSSMAGSEPIDWVRSYGSAAKLRSLLGPRTSSA